MEYCGTGSVSDLMRITNQTLSEEQIGTIIKDALMVEQLINSMKNSIIYFRDLIIYIHAERSTVI